MSIKEVSVIFVKQNGRGSAVKKSANKVSALLTQNVALRGCGAERAREGVGGTAVAVCDNQYSE